MYHTAQDMDKRGFQAVRSVKKQPHSSIYCLQFPDLARHSSGISALLSTNQFTIQSNGQDVQNMAWLSRWHSTNI